MSHKAILIISCGVSLLIGSGLNFLVRRDSHETSFLSKTKPAEVKPIKAIPDMIRKARSADDYNKEIDLLRSEVAKKYHLSVTSSYTLSNDEYYLFLERLMEDAETAQKLSNYKVSYMVSDEFKTSFSFVYIDARLSPRKVLEYIQTH